MVAKRKRVKPVDLLTDSVVSKLDALEPDNKSSVYKPTKNVGGVDFVDMLGEEAFYSEDDDLDKSKGKFIDFSKRDYRLIVLGIIGLLIFIGVIFYATL